jgi:glycosyltransferase involved in cell wall biosynthesis
MYLLEAIHRARTVAANASLLVVGTGELLEQARRKVEAGMLPVTFTGFLNQTEITQAYCAADCLVLPSVETWGLVVNEAMVCGLPAIVSDRVGCGPDLVEHGKTGYIFPFGDVDALAEKLLLVARDKPALLRMSEFARERVQSYSVEAAVKGTLEAIDAVTSRHSEATLRSDSRLTPA